MQTKKRKTDLEVKEYLLSKGWLCRGPNNDVFVKEESKDNHFKKSV